MTSYDNISRQQLVDRLLAPRSADDNDHESLLRQRLDLAREILLRDLSGKISSTPVMDSPDTLREWLSLYFLGKEREVFLVLFLDNRHRLLAAENLFAGTIDGTPVYPREIVKEALRHNAAAVCVAHNHPSGDAEPSACDRSLTLKVREALALVDIRLLDHLVVGGERIVSLAERGWV